MGKHRLEVGQIAQSVTAEATGLGQDRRASGRLGSAVSGQPDPVCVRVWSTGSGLEINDSTRGNRHSLLSPADGCTIIFTHGRKCLCVSTVSAEGETGTTGLDGTSIDLCVCVAAVHVALLGRQAESRWAGLCMITHKRTLLLITYRKSAQLRLIQRLLVTKLLTKNQISAFN